MTALSDLIAKLEAAREGSRELDCQIALAIGWTHDKRGREKQPWWRYPGAPEWSRRGFPPSLSQSLDAALAEMPEGYGMSIEYRTLKPGASVRLYRHLDASGPDDIAMEWIGKTYAPTPALALIIAILKAKETT